MRRGRRAGTLSPAATKRARAATSPQRTASATSWGGRASSWRTSRVASPGGAARSARCFPSPHERGCSMTTTKTRCDLLIRNAYVLTMDAKGTAYPDGAIAVDGRKILTVGPEAEVTRKVAPLRIIDAGGSLVHPGLIDLHYHATFHMVGKMIEERDTSKEDPGPWVAQQYTGLINAMGEEEEHANALLACLDMARNGVTAFLDPGTAQHPDAIAAAAEAIGIRASVADPWLWDLRGPQLSDIDGAPADMKRCRAVLGSELKRNKDPDALVRGHVASFGSNQIFINYVLARDQGDYVSPEDLLRMHTINGARALMLEDRIGSIEAGKRADLVIRTNAVPEANPLHNLVRQHLIVAGSKSIDTVLLARRVG